MVDDIEGYTIRCLGLFSGQKHDISTKLELPEQRGRNTAQAFNLISPENIYIELPTPSMIDDSQFPSPDLGRTMQ